MISKKPLVFLIFSFMALLPWKNAFAWGIRFNQSDYVTYDFESWKKTPELNIEQRTLHLKKIDPDPGGRQFQSSYLFVMKQGLTLSYVQVLLQCAGNPQEDQRHLVLLFSQSGTLNLENILTSFRYHMGMGDIVAQNIWSSLAPLIGIDRNLNPCSRQFEEIFKNNRHEALLQNSIVIDTLELSARRDEYLIGLKKFFDISRPTQE